METVTTTNTNTEFRDSQPCRGLTGVSDRRARQPLVPSQAASFLRTHALQHAGTVAALHRGVTSLAHYAFASRFDFMTGHPTRTEVLVRRGASADLAGLLALDPRSRHFVITDCVVDTLHGKRIADALDQAHGDVVRIVVPDGEPTKSLAGYAALASEVLRLEPDECSTIIAIGGGLVCNLAGMLAATLFRGVRLVHVPTTLMAQCDAAIGHKQAINGPGGKNLLGAYYAPSHIVVDPSLLQTLPRWRMSDGFAEVLKHAFAQDVELLDWTREGSLDDLDFVTQCIERNISLKCALMREDPTERNQGMVLQYGHTVGHAVEHASNYALGHGESVAIGMVAAARLSESLGIAEPGLVELHRQLIRRFDLPTEIPARLSEQAIRRKIRAGKRCIGDTAYMALVARPGVLHQEQGEHARPVPVDVLMSTLEGLVAPEASITRIAS